MIPITQTLEADVVVVGGGIGGLMAGISAADNGASVILCEKANTKRSGSGATGNDHFLCYIPEKHGPDLEPIFREVWDSLAGLCHDPVITRRFLLESFSVVKLWDQWGISMRPTGDWEYMGHAFPGNRPRVWLKYAGHNQKEVLTREAKKRGVRMLNHHPVVDLVRGASGIAGVLALNQSEDEPTFTLIKAKSVILATGAGNRLYPPSGTPGCLFNTAFCPSCTGAAQAQAWRIGGQLVNMELPNRHAGPKYLARCGKSTWIGLYKYPDGTLLGPFVTKPTRELGDITSDVWNSAFADLMANGRGPAYIDCSQTSKEDLEYMRWGMKSEGLTALLDYMEREGIDPARDAVEFTQYEPHLMGRGLEIDINGETNIPGLFAAGDMVGNFRGDIGGAAVYGWIGGRHAAERAQTQEFEDIAELPWVAERQTFYSQFMERSVGADWREANLALQQIMNDYVAAGPHRVRSESLLQAGLKYLGDVRAKIESEGQASCSHTLMRLVEVLDLMDCGEAVIHAALERKETRYMHIRSDFSFTNPLWHNKFLTIRKEGEKVVLNWRDRNN